MKPEKFSQEIEDMSKEIVSKFDEAWNGRDADALEGLFHEEADFQFYYGLMLRGRKRIKKYYAEKVFPNLPAGWKHVTRSFGVRLLTEGVAIGDGKVDLVDENEGDPEKRVQRRLKVTTVVVKEKENWLFSAVRLMVPVKDW